MRFIKFLTKVALILIVIHLLVFFIAGVEYNSPNRNRELLCAQLTTMVKNLKNGMTSYINLAEIKSFSWDRVHIFPPGANPKWIDDDLGMYWPTSRWTGIHYAENAILIVFTNRGKMAQYCRFNNRESGYYRQLYREDGYAYDNARFVIDEKYELRHLLKWVPNP